jgi:hypothetical protein
MLTKYIFLSTVFCPLTDPQKLHYPKYTIMSIKAIFTRKKEVPTNLGSRVPSETSPAFRGHELLLKRVEISRRGKI